MREELKYNVLASDLESLSDALCLEALFTARKLTQAPAQVRGGPWSSPKPLSETQLKQAQQTAKCETLDALAVLASTDQRSCLAKHLANVSFVTSTDAVGNTRVVVARRNRSGTRGNVCRKRALKDKVYTRTSWDHYFAHRGANAEENRSREYANRKR